MKREFLAIAAILTMASCTKEIGSDVENFGDDNVVRISSGIETRASGVEWAKGDAISLFACETQGSDTYATNKKHIAYQDGKLSTFTPYSDSDYFYYPSSTNIDVYAIYPYASGNTLSVYEIDVTDQSNHTLIDLMSACTTNVEKSTDDVQMTFNHRLSQIQVTLKAASNGGFADSELATASVTVGGTLTKGNYNLYYDINSTSNPAFTTTADSTADLTLSAASNIATFMVIPQTATPEFTITVNNVAYSVKAASELIMASGYIYTYTISVSQTAVSIKGYAINPWETSDQGGLTAGDN